MSNQSNHVTDRRKEAKEQFSKALTGGTKLHSKTGPLDTKHD